MFYTVLICSRRETLLSGFCIFLRRRMPRRGWSSIPTPSGWHEVIRGPRPYSAQWPHVSKGTARAKERRLHQSFQPHRRVRDSPSTWRRSWPTGCRIWRFCAERRLNSFGPKTRVPQVGGMEARAELEKHPKSSGQFAQRRPV